MRTVRRGAIIGGTIVGAFIAAIVAVDCAQPTQIIIDVRADKDLCADSSNVLSVGFGVTTVVNVNNLQASLGDFQTGCKDSANGIVGTETIKPSDDKSATIGVRIVAAVGGDPAACQNDQSNCIISTRLLTFHPGETVRETISLSGACKGEVCGENQDCVAGKCVDRTAIEDDGGIEPDTGNPTQPEAAPPPVEAGIPDTGPGDACAACSGGTARTCTAGKCTITCDNATCFNTSLCAPGLECTVLCNGPVACQGTQCGGVGVNNCAFDCSGEVGGGHCKNITCDAGTCSAICADAGTQACNGVSFVGKTDTITCGPSKDDATLGCDNVSCGAGAGTSCTRSCSVDAGATCGDGGKCAAGSDCTNYVVPPPIDAGPQ